MYFSQRPDTSPSYRDTGKQHPWRRSVRRGPRFQIPPGISPDRRMAQEVRSTGLPGHVIFVGLRSDPVGRPGCARTRFGARANGIRDLIRDLLPDRIRFFRPFHFRVQGMSRRSLGEAVHLDWDASSAHIFASGTADGVVPLRVSCFEDNNGRFDETSFAGCEIRRKDRRNRLKGCIVKSAHAAAGCVVPSQRPQSFGAACPTETIKAVQKNPCNRQKTARPSVLPQRHAVTQICMSSVCIARTTCGPQPNLMTGAIGMIVTRPLKGNSIRPKRA